jgi:hypothetical protein
LNNLVIFSGPTISHEQGLQKLDAIYLDPAGQGDIYQAYRKYKPSIIGLIDGFFENSPSVWHKEILFVMSQGTHVLGSSSMGALRASELHAFGMLGVGEIFQLYKECKIEDDDEVAIAHGPKNLGYPALSEAMVNMRKTLLDAFEQDVISEVFYLHFLETAKNEYYKRRTYHNILKILKSKTDLEKDAKLFLEWLPHNARNLKQEDAWLLLEKIKDMIATGISPKEVDYHFEETWTWLESISEESRNGISI